MLATVVWVGALAVLTMLVIPIGRKSLSRQDFSKLLEDLLRRLDPIAWLCLVLLIATGLVQMTGNPNYEGFLAVNNTWAIAILAKHLVFAAMIPVSAAMTWWALPALRRQALINARRDPDQSAAESSRREVALVRINFGLSVIVLALTALARTA